MTLDSLTELLADLPRLLAGHLFLSIAALAVGTATSVPLGILAARSERLRRWALLGAGTVQTIPTLALLALMVPLFGGQIGFLPAFVALVLYSVLPVLRNTVTGIAGIEPGLVRAARGLGMSEGQVLRRVRLPLAAPVIVAGIRTATVWVVGMATIATLVGAPSLGNFIFTGLQTRNHASTLVGCVAAALLALVLDGLIGTAERALTERRRVRLWTSLAVLAGIVVVGTLPLMLDLGTRIGTQQLGADGASDAVGEGGTTSPLDGLRLVTGSKPFTESYILGELLALRLRRAGAEVDLRPSMGSTVIFDALAGGDVDCYVDYSGTIWANHMKRTEPADRLSVVIEVAEYLRREHGVITVGPLGFENTYFLAMTEGRAAALGVRDIGELAPHAVNLRVGGDPEVFGRPEWERVRDTYGLAGIETVGMQAIYLYDAVHKRQVDVITAYSTDGRIAASGLRVLEDTQRVFPPYDALLLVSPAAAQSQALTRTLRLLVNRIDDDLMRRANRLVEVDGETSRAAAEWLDSQIDVVR